MKTQTTVKWLVLCAVASFVAGGCRKEGEVQKKSDILQEESIIVKNDMLSFKTQNDLDNVLTKLHNLKSSEVEIYLDKYKYPSLANDSLAEDLANTVKDPIFRRLLNKNGAMIIGDKIFLTKGDHYYLLNELKFDLYNKIIANKINAISEQEGIIGKVNTQSEIIDLNVNKSERGGAQIATTYTQAPFNGSLEFYSSEYDNGRPERVRMEIWSQSYAVSASKGVKLLGQAYRRGGLFGSKNWRNDEVQYGRISGSVDTGDGKGREFFDTGDQIGTEEVNHTFISYSGTVPASPKIYFLDVTFKYQKTSQNPMGGYNHVIQ